ncbi:hypothetical protein C8Q75DRAFT_806889 [Abortiporus biennis]|nr:hypothetical protein C8Q75DRAFT_806889 [Abortiporus biennis]
MNDRYYNWFVLLESLPRFLPGIPTSTRNLLNSLSGTLSSFPVTNDPYPLLVQLNTPPDITPENMVPFAAILLEYPVAYVPHSSNHNSSSYLSGVELTVFECTLDFGGVDIGIPPDHIFIKFSCPTYLVQLVENTETLADKIHSQLMDKFTGRLESNNIPASVKIRRFQETHDRVAL